MTPLYDIEIEADRYEDQLAYAREMWAKIGASERGEVKLSAEEQQETISFLCGLFHRND